MTSEEKIEKLLSYINTSPGDSRAELEKLYDEGSFIEIGFFNDCSVITGYGTINEKLVYSYSQCGAVNSIHAKKISRIYELALEVGAPVIGILDSNGIKLDDISDSFESYGNLLANQSRANGVVPQISVIKGDCIGMASFIPALSNFTFMINKSRMFINSPNSFKNSDAKNLSYESFGGGKACAEKGTATEYFDNTDDCFLKIKEILSLLPSNNIDDNFVKTNDDLNREDAFLNSVVIDETSPIDITGIIKSIADNNKFTEIKKMYADSIITGFIRLDGLTTGIIANNGLITSEASEKAYSFVQLCDSFNIPILTLTDINGYEKNSYEEQKGIIKNSAKLISAFVNASVPKINVILRNAVGSGYLLMNSKSTGADIVYAWPTATISGITKESALDIFKIQENDYNDFSSPYYYVKKGQVDDIIIPAATRKRVIAAIEMLFNKRIVTPNKKHDTI